jgi:heme-degrading monooxygenase HmoA
MIVRFVKMTFREDCCEEFEQLFHMSKGKIKSMPGCKHVELLRELNHGKVYFTRSIWENELDLNNYRDSDLFEHVWKATKKLFESKPEAWSTNLVLETNEFD